MKRLFILFIILSFFHKAEAQYPVGAKASDLIPKPTLCNDLPGFFEFQPEKTIYASVEFTDAANLLTELLRDGNKLAGQANKAAIVFTKASPNEKLGAEGYKLNISPEKIEITAETV